MLGLALLFLAGGIPPSDCGRAETARAAAASAAAGLGMGMGPPPEGVAALLPGSQLMAGHVALPLPPAPTLLLALPDALLLGTELPLLLLLALLLPLPPLVLALVAAMPAKLLVLAVVLVLVLPAPLKRLAKGRMRGEGAVRRTPIPPLPGLGATEPGAGGPLAGVTNDSGGPDAAGYPCESWRG